MRIWLLNRDDFGAELFVLGPYPLVMSEHDGLEDDVVLDLTVLVGMWADSTRVHRAQTEFTVDFVRNVPLPLGRALVARAVVTPVVAVELRDQLATLL